MSIISKLKAKIGNNVPKFIEVFGKENAVRNFGLEAVNNALGINNKAALDEANVKAVPSDASVVELDVTSVAEVNKEPTENSNGDAVAEAVTSDAPAPVAASGDICPIDTE